MAATRRAEEATLPLDKSKTFKPVNIALLTVSDTREASDDSSGDILAERITAAGHKLVVRAIERSNEHFLSGGVTGSSM